MSRDEAIDDLQLFVRRVELMLQSKLGRRAVPLALTISWNHLRGLQILSEEPDEDELRSFLTHLRPFMLKGDPVYALRIHNLCQQHLTSEGLKGALQSARDAWIKAQKECGLRLVINDRHWSPEDVTDLWINGYYFHNDRRKLRALEQLFPPNQTLTRYLFLTFTNEAARIVSYMGAVIRAALKERAVA